MLLQDKTKSVTPENSRNTRVYCGDCDTYLAEDARTPLGVWMMPHSAVNGQVKQSHRLLLSKGTLLSAHCP